MARNYAVFNREQVDHAPELGTEQRPPLERHAECDRIIREIGANISYGGDRAAYIRSQDRIVLPKPEQFLRPKVTTEPRSMRSCIGAARCTGSTATSPDASATGPTR